MAEGTRLREMNEHLHALEERMQQFTIEYSDKVEEMLHQLNSNYSKNMGTLAQQLDEIQQNGQQRYEALQHEAAR